MKDSRVAKTKRKCRTLNAI